MKAQLLVLSAAGLLLAAAPLSSALAGSAETDRYVAAATADAGERLAERSVDLAGKTLAVRGRVQGDRLSGLRVVSSSGSAELDNQVAAALKNLRTDAAPVELVGRELTLTLGAAAPVAAVATR
jgi:hypothetical protein